MDNQNYVSVPRKTLESWLQAARNDMSAYLEAVIKEYLAAAPAPEAKEQAISMDDIAELIGAAQFMQDQANVEAKGRARIVAEIAQKLHRSLITQETAEQPKTYTREEVQKWRDDVAHAAANMVQQSLDGSWQWLVDSIRGLAASPQAQPKLTDAEIVAAVKEACGTGRVSLIFTNNEDKEVPTDVARCFARALLAAQGAGK